jgi:hypothetical protein
MPWPFGGELPRGHVPLSIEQILLRQVDQRLRQGLFSRLNRDHSKTNHILRSPVLGEIYASPATS